MRSGTCVCSNHPSHLSSSRCPSICHTPTVRIQGDLSRREQCSSFLSAKFQSGRSERNRQLVKVHRPPIKVGPGYQWRNHAIHGSTFLIFTNKDTYASLREEPGSKCLGPRAGSLEHSQLLLPLFTNGYASSAAISNSELGGILPPQFRPNGWSSNQH